MTTEATLDVGQLQSTIRLRGAKFATFAFSDCDTNQTLTGTQEASFRSPGALWDYVPLMAQGNPTSVMIKQQERAGNLHWRMYQAQSSGNFHCRMYQSQLNYYIYTYAHLHRPRRRG
eukprot:3905607-Rhodomonas_salina.1